MIGQRAAMAREELTSQCVQRCPILLLLKPFIGPYNTEKLIYFLNDLHNRLVPAEERGASNSSTFIGVWDNVAFQHSAAHSRMSVLYLPPYSPFLNLIEEFFSVWRWKVSDHRPDHFTGGNGCWVWSHFS